MSRTSAAWAASPSAIENGGRDGVDERIQSLELRFARVEELDGRDFAAAHPRDQLGCRAEGDFASRHARKRADRAESWSAARSRCR